MFNFKALINNFTHTLPFYVKIDSYYDYDDGGVLKTDIVSEEEFTGAVVPLSKDELKYEENGRYNKEDRKLYCYKSFKNGEYIKHKEKLYIIDKQKDYSDFDKNLYIYFLVRSDVGGAKNS